MTVVRVGLGLVGLGLQELLVADGGEGGGLVNNGSGVDPLVNGDGLVNSGGLDGLSLDDGLDYMSVIIDGTEKEMTYWSRGCGGARAPG